MMRVHQTMPASVRIGGRDYRVQSTPNLRHDNQLRYGQIDYDEGLIEISETDCRCDDKRFITLWHEMLHGIAEHADLDMPSDIEENIIRVFSRGIVQVIEDNPMLFTVCANDVGAK